MSDIIDRVNQRFSAREQCRWPKSGTPYWATLYWLALMAICVAREALS